MVFSDVMPCLCRSTDSSLHLRPNQGPQISLLRAFLVSLALTWPGMALSQQTLVVDSNNNQGCQA